MKNAIWIALAAGQFLAFSAQAAPFSCRDQESYLTQFDAIFRNPTWETLATDAAGLKTRQLQKFLAFRGRDGVSYAHASTALSDYVFGVVAQGDSKLQFVGAIGDFVYHDDYPDASFGFFRFDSDELVGFFGSDTDRGEAYCLAELAMAIETGKDPTVFAGLVQTLASDQASADFTNALVLSLCKDDSRFFNAFAAATHGFAATSESVKEELFLSFDRCPDRISTINDRLDTVLSAIEDVNQLGSKDPQDRQPVIHTLFSFAEDLASAKALVALLVGHGFSNVGALDSSGETVLFHFFGSWNEEIVALSAYLLDPANTNGGVLDVNQKNDSGDTALCRAVPLYLKGRANDTFAKPRTFPFIQLLVEKGADPRLACADGQSPAAQACQAKAHELTKLFHCGSCF